MKTQHCRIVQNHLTFLKISWVTCLTIFYAQSLNNQILIFIFKLKILSVCAYVQYNNSIGICNVEYQIGVIYYASNVFHLCVGKPQIILMTLKYIIEL